MIVEDAGLPVILRRYSNPFEGIGPNPPFKLVGRYFGGLLQFPLTSGVCFGRPVWRRLSEPQRNHSGTTAEPRQLSTAHLEPLAVRRLSLRRRNGVPVYIANFTLDDEGIWNTAGFIGFAVIPTQKYHRVFFCDKLGAGRRPEPPGARATRKRMTAEAVRLLLMRLS